jgi:simple sugar transport system permease protein
MMALVETLGSAVFLVAVIRTVTPIALAALGGLVADLAGVANVALEGMMLSSALGAVLASVHAPWWGGVLAGAGTGAALGLAMTVFHLAWKADLVLTGFAVNIISSGLTVVILYRATGGDKGTSIALASKAIPPLPGEALSGISTLSALAVLLTLLVWFVLTRTRAGLHLRATGLNPAAARAAGIDVRRLQAMALILSGALVGLAGAQLAMFNFVGFTRDMTGGRGFIALGAVVLGRRHPLGTLAAATLFGAFEALAIVIPGLYAWVPAELVGTIPYVATIAALVAVAAARVSPRRSAPATPRSARRGPGPSSPADRPPPDAAA